MGIIAAQNPDNVPQIILAAGLMMVLLVLGFLAVWYYRKKVLYSEAETSSADQPWTLDDLRKMRDRGDLTEEEFQSLRSAMIGSLAGRAAPADRAIPQSPALKPGNSDFDLEKDLGG